MERRMLWKLPPDLQAMSWQWVPPESRARQRGSATWYTAVYARPFDRGVDDDHLAVYYDGGWWVRAAAEAAAISDFEGTQPVHRQSPPGRSRSTSRTRASKPAAVFAATRPAVPPPMTRRSQGDFVKGRTISHHLVSSGGSAWNAKAVER